MRFGKFIVIVLAVFFINGTLWAAGSKENVSRSAEDPTGFQDSIDISSKKPGKYNYYLEATDKAQNVTLSGPENIFNDPESDLPRVSIINPIPFMKVQGNLNIVGLAFDDDGVKSVEFAIYKGTDGKGAEVMRAVATGKDYLLVLLFRHNKPGNLAGRRLYHSRMGHRHQRSFGHWRFLSEWFKNSSQSTQNP